VNPNDLDYVANLERYRDRVREADRARLVKQARVGRDYRNRFYVPMLNWLGRRLVAWGLRLQACREAAAATPTLRPAEHRR